MTATSRLGLGLAALGRPAYITAGRARDLGADRSEDELDRLTGTVLDAAYAAGIRYVDCARSYGLSERFLAHWLGAHREITDLTVASKWGYRYVGDWRRDVDVHEVKDHSTDAFRTQLAETRHELGDRLDIYQVHSVTPDSPALRDPALLSELAALRDQGVRVGLSTSGPGQAQVIRQALDLTVGGESLFSVVQSTWNLLETSAAPALAEASAAGWSVVVKEALANGRLAPAGEDSNGAVARLDRLAAAHDISLDQLALATALDQSWSTRVLSGAVTPAQIESNVSAAHLTLDPDAYAEAQIWAEEPHHYWQARSQRPWA